MRGIFIYVILKKYQILGALAADKKACHLIGITIVVGRKTNIETCTEACNGYSIQKINS